MDILVFHVELVSGDEAWLKDLSASFFVLI